MSQIHLFSEYFWVPAIIAGIYIYLKFFLYAYWKNHGIPHESPIIPIGNVLPVITGKMNTAQFFKKSYETFGKHRFHGIYVFNQAVMMINDPKLIHQILIKEFDKFSSRGFFSNEKVDPLTLNLVFISSEKWKKLRPIFSATFTPKKMKEMSPLIKEISDELIQTCDKNLQNNDVIEMKDLLARYTIDIISSLAFGFNCRSLSDPDNEFKRYGTMVFDRPATINILFAHAPFIMDFLGIPYFPKDTTYFFTKIFRDAVNHRKQEKIVRKDFINLLIQMIDENGNDVNENNITMVEAQAQAFMFFVAGFESSSLTMTYLLYELVLNPEVQEKVYEEIGVFLTGGEMSYNRIKERLPFLDTVISETLRKYPPFPMLSRLCDADWKIPDSDFTVKQGSRIIIPVIGLHYDPDLYPDPEKFDPNRFSNDTNSTRSSRVHLPFGDGPRNCIGFQLAMFQMKLGLVALLSNYKFSKCNETIVPMKYSPRSFTQTPLTGIYLRIEKRIRH